MTVQQVSHLFELGLWLYLLISVWQLRQRRPRIPPNVDGRDRPPRYTNANFVYPDGLRKLTDLFIDSDGNDTYLLRDYDNDGQILAVVVLQTGYRLGCLHWQTVRALGRWDPRTPADGLEGPQWAVHHSGTVAYVARQEHISRG